MGEPGVRQATVGAPCGRPTGIPTSPGSSAQRKLVWASRSWPCVIARACRGGLRPPLQARSNRVAGIPIHATRLLRTLRVLAMTR
jgi:hypothetical protein